MNATTTPVVPDAQTSVVTAPMTLVRVTRVGQAFHVGLQVVQGRLHGLHHRVHVMKVTMGVTTHGMKRVVLNATDEFFQVVEETVGLGHVTFQVVDAATSVSHRMNVTSHSGQAGTIGPQMSVIRHVAIVQFKFAVQLTSLLLQLEG